MFGPKAENGGFVPSQFPIPGPGDQFLKSVVNIHLFAFTGREFDPREFSFQPRRMVAVFFRITRESGEPGHPFSEIPAALRLIGSHGNLRHAGRAKLEHRAEFRRQQLGLLSPRTPQGGTRAGKDRQITKMIGEPQSHRAGV